MNDQLNAQQCREIIAELAMLLPQAMAKHFPRLPRLDFEIEGEDEEEVVRTRWDPVFTGGGIVSMLITDPEAPQAMFTKDVDLVLEIASHPDFYAMEKALESVGFRRPRDEHTEILSWEWRGVRVDALPHRRIQSLDTNRWFVFLMKDAEHVEVLPGRRAWIASAPCFIATKLQAFASRGNNNFLKSKDIGDILAVVNGRDKLLQEIHRAAPEVREFLRQRFGWLLEQPHFMESLSLIVPENQREEIVIDRMRQIGSPT
ncbi:MAG: hypothetical protein IPK22_10560 [Verrucomicrobiaceae bacterium]|nr:hypothetical protein [Verrucomicrobiaceae bacterium]